MLPVCNGEGGWVHDRKAGVGIGRRQAPAKTRVSSTVRKGEWTSAAPTKQACGNFKHFVEASEEGRVDDDIL